MKYKIGIILICILYFFFVVMIALSLLNPNPNEGDLTPLIPGGTTSDLSIQFLVIIPLGAIIGSLLGYIFAPLFLLVHKKTVGRSLSYGIIMLAPYKNIKKIKKKNCNLFDFSFHAEITEAFHVV